MPGPAAGPGIGKRPRPAMPSFLSRTTRSRRRRGRRPLPSAWLATLESRVAYYQVLPAREQAELRGMVGVLMGEVSFEAGAGLAAVDETMQILIAAQAGVLLLHRPLADLPRIETAIVYPGAYHARETRHTQEGVEVEEDEERLGEAWSYGTLLLSGEDVLYDSIHIDDGTNVVFHEVAHALDAQTGESDGVPLLADQEAVEAWRQAFGAALDALGADLQRRRKTLLGAYAAEDEAEFFAAATETFFERPVSFQAVYPDLYPLMRDFYQLDPLTWAHLLRRAGA